MDEETAAERPGGVMGDTDCPKSAGSLPRINLGQSTKAYNLVFVYLKCKIYLKQMLAIANI